MEKTSALRRLRFPIVVTALIATLVLGLWVLSGDLLNVGDRRVFSTVATVLGGVLIAGWFWLASGAPWRQRLATFLLVLAVIGALLASVRRVNFSGDMTPNVVWRWSDLPGVAAEAQHAARTGKTSGLDPVNLTPGKFDCLEYRGPARDGIVPGPALTRDWSSVGPKLLWEQPIGGGYGAFVVAGNVLITIEQRRDDECIACYDRETGVEQWTYRYPEHFSEMAGGEGPRSTPTVWDGKVYALGAGGHLACLDAADGAMLWTENVLERSGVKNVQWGMSGSPLLVDGMAVVNCGVQDGDEQSSGVLAFDAISGKLKWKAGKSQGSYASPMLATLGEKRQILIFDAAGLAAHDLDDGTELWRFEWKSDFDINAVQPIVVDQQRVLISSNAGAALVQVVQAGDAWSVDEIWRNRSLKCNFSCPILHAGYVYGLDNGILACLDVETGNRQWKGGRYGHGQMLLRDDLIVVLAETGHLALVEATPEEFRELGKIEPFPSQKTWNNPTLVEDLAYIRNDLNMACYRLPTDTSDHVKTASETEPPSPDTGDTESSSAESVETD